MITLELTQSYRCSGHNVDVYEMPDGDVRFFVDNIAAFWDQDDAEAYILTDLEGFGGEPEEPYERLRRWELI
jgi:hypothetical protein